MSAEINKRKSKRKRIILISLAALLFLSGLWGWQEGRPWYYGIKAYIYGFPLIVMDMTRQASTATLVVDDGEFRAPVNQFAVMTAYPDASYRIIPHTGLDAQFACAWADLDAEPLILSVPNTNGRYYVIALFDMWSNVFASIGSRTTGNDSASFIIAGPKWSGTAPAGLTVYKSPTRYVWVNGQMRSNGAAEYSVVSNLQKQYRLTPLSKWRQPYDAPASVAFDPLVDTKQSVYEQISKMDAQTYFGKLAQLMKDNPPSPDDADMIETLKFLGMEPGKYLDFSKLDGNMKRGLTRAMVGYTLLQKGTQKLESDKGWAVLPHNIAKWGTDYLTRAGIALIGLGAIWSDDISYPTAFNDIENKPLDGSKKYVLHFDKDQLPPVKETWSVSSYDPNGWYIPNSINRYVIAQWMPLKYNADGSLDIYIQAESPGADKESNWLPCTKSGSFNVIARLFWPEESALNGAWKMPGVKIAE